MSTDEMKPQLDRIEHAVTELRDRARAVDARYESMNARLMTLERRFDRFAGESESRDARHLSVLRLEAENIRQMLRLTASSSAGRREPRAPKRPTKARRPRAVRRAKRSKTAD